LTRWGRAVFVEDLHFEAALGVDDLGIGDTQKHAAAGLHIGAVLNILLEIPVRILRIQGSCVLVELAINDDGAVMNTPIALASPVPVSEALIAPDQCDRASTGRPRSACGAAREQCCCGDPLGPVLGEQIYVFSRFWNVMLL
jgi:hypothetical protein